MLSALSLDPGSPERWADVAEVMHEAQRDDDTRYCLDQELARAPHLAHVAMRAAGMYFRLGDPVTALRLTNRVVNETREYDPNVFQTWQRLGGTATQVFQWGVGSNVRAGQGYFRFLVDARDPGPMDAAWPLLQEKKMAGLEEARFYAEALTASHEFDLAAEIESSILPQGVWNGGFEDDWSGRGLDWRAETAPGVTISRDTAVHYSGTASLRLEFDGSSRNEFGHVSQTRVLASGNWLLRAMIRTDLKGTTGGVGLRILDEENGRVLAETGKVGLVHEWTPVEASLNGGLHARPIRIVIARPASVPSETTMTGTAWVDDVTITADDVSRKMGNPN